MKRQTQISKAREGSPSVGSNPTATAIYQVKRWSSCLPVTGVGAGWLHLSVHGGGLADVPYRPGPGNTRVADAGGSTVVALNKTTQSPASSMSSPTV